MATYSDQFYVMDPGNPPPSGTQLTVEQFQFDDSDDDDFIEPNVGDTFDGSEITAVWDGDRILVEYPDGSTDVITGVTFYTVDGRAVFTPTDDTVLQDAEFLASDWVTVSTQVPVGDFGPPCFVAGTRIHAESGIVPIETLSVGDRVWTRDRGLQVIRWRGHRRVRGDADHAPILFEAGAFGNVAALMVSPQHRMLVTGWQAQLWFGEDEVLVPAKHLVNGTTIRVRPMRNVEYHHILFDGHEIVESEGIHSESFHPASYILGTDDEMREEILGLFPELTEQAGSGLPPTARTVIRRHEACVLRQPVLVAA